MGPATVFLAFLAIGNVSADKYVATLQISKSQFCVITSLVLTNVHWSPAKGKTLNGAERVVGYPSTVEITSAELQPTPISIAVEGFLDVKIKDSKSIIQKADIVSEEFRFESKKQQHLSAMVSGFPWGYQQGNKWKGGKEVLLTLTSRVRLYKLKITNVIPKSAAEKKEVILTNCSSYGRLIIYITAPSVGVTSFDVEGHFEDDFSISACVKRNSGSNKYEITGTRLHFRIKATVQRKNKHCSGLVKRNEQTMRRNDRRLDTDDEEECAEENDQKSAGSGAGFKQIFLVSISLLALVCIIAAMALAAKKS